MVLKEFKWIEEDLNAILRQVRSAVKKETLKFPGAVAHRLNKSARSDVSEKKPRRD
jgi:hypothetical protein